jgi:hypothetical protein
MVQKHYRILISALVVWILSFPGNAPAFGEAAAAADTPAGFAPLEHTERRLLPYRTPVSGIEKEPDKYPALFSEPGVAAASAYLEETPSLVDYGAGIFPDLIGGVDKIFSGDNLQLALIGSGLAALAGNVDHVDGKVKIYFQTRQPLDGVSKYGNLVGQYYYHLGVGAAFFSAGEIFQRKKWADTGMVILESALINGIATQTLKYSTHRLRPNGTNYMSFPSGHVSSTASLAASISAMYDWNLVVSVPLYATAFFVGASRIQGNMHYLSDVIAGLTLGTVVGASVAAYHKEKNSREKSDRKISFAPLFEKDLKGAVFTMKW